MEYTAATEPRVRSRNGARPEGREGRSSTRSRSTWRTLPQWSPPRRAGGTLNLRERLGLGGSAAMEPAPKGGRDQQYERMTDDEHRAAMEPAPKGGRDLP